MDQVGFSIGIFEVLILAVLGLVCIGVPIGIVAVLMVGKRRDEK